MGHDALPPIDFVITVKIPRRKRMVMGTIKANSLIGAQDTVLAILGRAGIPRHHFGKLNGFSRLCCGKVTLYIDPLQPFEDRWASVTRDLIKDFAPKNIAKKKSSK